MRRRITAWLPLALRIGGFLALTGCADNAILELEVCLPDEVAGEREYALVQVRRITEDTNFENDIPWVGTEDQHVPLQSIPVAFDVSAETTKDNIDVAVRVSYCKNIDCASEFPAESRFVLLDPYTIGERTKATLNAATVPSGKGTPVEYKCSKGRCVPSGTGVSPVCGQSSPPEDAATPDVGDSGDAGDQTDF